MLRTDYPILDGYSVEVLPGDADPKLLAQAGLPAGSEVFIAHLPGHTFQGVRQAARRLIEAGYVPVPHFCVRRWTEPAQVQDSLINLREAGVDRMLVIAGEAPEANRLWDSAMDFLQSGEWAYLAPEKLFVAGHPEGMQHMSGQGTDLLLAKQAFAMAHRIRLEIISQFVLDAGLFATWEKELRANGIHLPIRAGMPGQVTPATLVKYALRCGVGAAMQATSRQKDRLMQLAKSGSMAAQIKELQAQVRGNPDSLIRTVHFFPFGSLQNTLEWASNQQA